MRPRVLGPVDNAFYYVDRPETPMNIGALTIFEGKIPFNDFLKFVDSRIFQAPIYQQRIVQAPYNLGQPQWVFDPDFYVGNHVFKVTLNPPGTDEQLREMAGHLVSGMLDRSRPLWQLYLIDGLADNRTGLLFKVHHCMVDGLAAVELFTLLMDMTPDAPPPGKKPLYDPPRLPERNQMISDAILQDLPQKWDIVRKVGHDLGVIGSILGNKEKRRRALIGVSYLVNDNLQLIRKLPINGKNTGKMRIAWAEFSLNEVHAIRATEHASVNDVMLTLLSGAVDDYVQRHGGAGDQHFLRLIVPVNVRAEEEKGAYGNRISVLTVDIPFGIRDPLERLRAVKEYSQVMKQSSLSNGLDLILTLPSLAPAITQPLIWELAPTAFALIGHAWCTNVAGPPIPVYLLGHQMLHTYGYFPLNPTMGLACVIASYNQRITMTLVTDAGIVPDVKSLKESLDGQYLALRRAAKVQPMDRVPDPKPSAVPSARAEAVKPPPAAPLAVKPAVKPAADSVPTAAVPPAVKPVKATPPASDSADSTSTADSASSAAAPQADAVAAAVESPVSITIQPIESAPCADDRPSDAGSIPVMDAASISVVAALAGNGKLASEVEREVIGTRSGSAPAAAPTAESTAAPQVTAETAPEVASETGIAGEFEAIRNAESEAETESEAEVETEAESETEAETAAPAAAVKLKLFSEEWAQAYRTAINSSEAYHNASTRWDAGSLAFVMQSSIRDGYPQATAVYMDLHRGLCRGARNLSPRDAEAEAAFVIEGDYATWMRVLSGKVSPLVMLMFGRLYLKKGSMTKLLPFTQSAQELVNCAQSIS